VLLAAGLLSPVRRLGVLRDLAIGAAGVVGLAFALQRVDPTLRLDQQIVAMLQKGTADAGYLFSAVHARDFFSEQVLIGPFALLWFIPVLVYTTLRRERPSAPLVFLIVAGAVQALAFWLVTDLPLGYARDWDLFAPFATVFVVAALGLSLARLSDRGRVLRLALVVIAVSLFHTVPWVALNASADRSVERFKHLPLGKGRTESTVGFWYFSQGREQEATEWLQRALVADPSNVRAHAHLGNMAMSAGRFADAERHFESAVLLRPNQPMFRENLVRVLLIQNRIEDALSHLSLLVNQAPDQPRYWAMVAVLLYGGGRPMEAHQAMLRAVQLAPQDSVYASALARIGQQQPVPAPEVYAALIEHEWPLIVNR
jgi:tetratricopeptide (TPR) repeat protein